jgi:hypothetical protein
MEKLAEKPLNLPYLVFAVRPPHYHFSATGLGAIGLLGWRRKRKAQAGLPN